MAAGEVSRERDLPDERVSWSEGITAESITAENVQRFARICYGLYCLQGVVSVCGRTFIALFLKDCGLSYIEVGLFFSISIKIRKSPQRAPSSRAVVGCEVPNLDPTSTVHSN